MKRMILIFEESLQKEIPNDVDYIFAYNENVISNYNGQAEIIHYNMWESSESEEPQITIEKFLSNSNSRAQLIKNTFYSNLIAPIHSMISQINNIIREKSIEELILVKGSKHVFCSFELAESEGTPFIYKSTWLFNSIIQQYFRETGIYITWQKRSRFTIIYRMVNRWREHLIKVHEFLLEFYRYIKTKHKIDYINYKEKEINAVCFVNLQGQYDFMKAYLKNRSEFNPIFVTPRAFDNECIVIKGVISPRKVINNLWMSYQVTREKYDNYIFIDNRKIYLDRKSIIAAITTELFIYYNAIDRVINTYKKIEYPDLTCMITCMSQGRSMIKYTEAAKRLNIKHINYQYVSLGKRCFPIMDLADEYYIYEIGSYAFYREKSRVFRFYLPQLRNKCMECKNHTIVIYTQPDQYAALYLQFIKSFLCHTSNLKQKFKIIIKLHYRQNKREDFIKFQLFENVSVVTTEYSINELMDISSFCISMTSSVLSEATFYKVPAFIYVEDEGLIQYVTKAGIGYPEINYIVRNIDDLCEKIQRFNKEEYQKRYDSFLLKALNLNEKEGG